MARFRFKGVTVTGATGPWTFTAGSPAYYDASGLNPGAGTLTFGITPTTTLELGSGSFDGTNFNDVLDGPTGPANAPPAGFFPTTFIWALSNLAFVPLTGTQAAPATLLTFDGHASGSKTLAVLPDNTSYALIFTATGTQDVNANTGISATRKWFPSLFQLVGNYEIMLWWYNLATNHYQLAASTPGTGWAAASPDPVPVISSVKRYSTYTDSVASVLASPAFGCVGTALTITGTGFGDSATVTVGGVAATSVVVVDQTTITCVVGAHADAVVDVVVTNADGTSVTSAGAFTYVTPWWIRTETYVTDGVSNDVLFYVQQCAAPSTRVWVISNTTPPYVADPSGWFVSTAAYTGDVTVAPSGEPSDPRSWADIVAWATGERAMLGGAPAANVVYRNRLVYAASGYTVGTQYPPVRVFNGAFDRELCRLPPTLAGAVPQAIMAMLAANGTIYLTSFDSGTTSATWAGRVFSLDLASGVLTQIGAAFTGGELPYALGWHMGRLWVGTNNGIGTVGKIYYFRPGVDTAWTLDHSTATDSAGGVTSICSYNGKLYVGTDNAAASRGKVLQRDSAGTYTISETGAGGAAAIVNNGYLAVAAFEGNLYASYWNHETPAVALVRKFDGTTWTTAYTGAAGTLRPFIMLFSDNGTLFAFGGGLALTGVVVSTPDGTTWTNRTANLPESTRTVLPFAGTLVF